MSHLVELRLTANLQLRRSSQSSRACVAGLRQRACGAASRGPGGVTIVDPSALRLSARALFAPGRARDIVSDVLCRGLPRTEHCCPIPVASSHRGPLPSPSRQRRRSPRTRTPSVVRVLPPPVAQDARAPARGITRSPPPVSLLACWWLSPPRSGFRRRFTRCARTPLGVFAIELDPRSFDLGPSAARRLLQSTQSASTTAMTA